MFKIKLIINEIRRWKKQRRCEHEWVVPKFYANQKEYRVFCPRCGKELWWGGRDE